MTAPLVVAVVAVAVSSFEVLIRGENGAQDSVTDFDTKMITPASNPPLLLSDFMRKRFFLHTTASLTFVLIFSPYTLPPLSFPPVCLFKNQTRL